LVTLRLRRMGKKNQPVYKIVAADSRAARDGKFLEAIGHYNPRIHPALIEVKEDRLFMWLRRGARPTDTVRSLLRRKGLWLKWALTKRGADEAKVAAELEKWQVAQAEKLVRESQKKSRRKAARKAKAASTKGAAEQPAAPAEAPPSGS